MYNLILLTHVQPGYITVLSKYVHFQELHRYLGILWDLTVPSKGLGPFLQHLATSFARFKSQGCSWVQRMATSLVYLWSDSISNGADVCRGCCEKWFCECFLQLSLLAVGWDGKNHTTGRQQSRESLREEERLSEAWWSAMLQKSWAAKTVVVIWCHLYIDIFPWLSCWILLCIDFMILCMNTHLQVNIKFDKCLQRNNVKHISSDVRNQLTSSNCI